MSFKKVFFTNISTLALYNYLSIGIEFLATIVLSRLLLPEEYGFVAMITVFANFIRLFSNIGIGTAVIRSNYRYTYHKHLFSLSIWLGITLCLSLSLLSYPIALFFKNKALILPTIVVSLKFVFDAFNYISIAILSKKLKFRIVGKNRLLGSSIQIFLMILFAFMGFSYWSLIIPLIIAPIIQYGFLRKYVDLPIRIYGWKAAKRMIYRIKSLMGNLSLTNLIGYWSSNADKMIIGRMYMQADLGLYNRAFRFLQISNRLITSIFSSALLPSLKKLADEGGDTQKEFMDIIRIITLFNFPLILLMVIFPEELVSILWGNNWTGVATFLPYVGIIIIFTSIVKVMNSVFLLYGKEQNLFLITLVRSIVTIALIIIGGFFSIMHIIKFLTLGYVLFTVPLNIYYGFYKSFHFNIKKILYFWIPALLFGILLFISIENNSTLFKLLVIISFFLFLVYDLRETISKSAKFLWIFFKRKINYKITL